MATAPDIQVINSPTGGVTLCLSPNLAKLWSDGLASGLGARAVFIPADVVEKIRG